MHYLKLRRSRAILTSFSAAALLFMVFPGIDIFISRLFFDQGFYLSRQWWTMLMHDSMGYFLGLSLASVVALCIWNKLTRRNVCGVDAKRVVYLFLVLILALFSALALTCANELLEPTRLSRAILIGLTVFWGLRLAVQWGFYSSALWRGHRFNTFVHYGFSILWVYLTAVFGAALWMNLQ